MQLRSVLLLLTLWRAPATSDGNVSGWSRSLRGPQDPLYHLLQENSAREGNVVTIDFFYGPACPNCLTFMRLAVIPLLEAGLPGSRVKLSVLPFIKLEGNIPLDLQRWDTVCRASDICYYALAPLCALQNTIQAASPVDSIDLARAVHFAECSQARRLAMHPKGHFEVTAALQVEEHTTSRQCAAQAGVAFDGPSGIGACADGSESVRLMRSQAYMRRIQHFEHVMAKAGHEHLPYIFLDGEDMLRCAANETGVDCLSVWEKTGKRSQHSGSLLYAVCSRLDPKPPACKGVGPAVRVQVGPTPSCENCAESLSVRWQPTQTPLGSVLLSLASVGIVGCAAGLAALLVWWNRKRRGQADKLLVQDPEPAVIVE